MGGGTGFLPAVLTAAVNLILGFAGKVYLGSDGRLLRKIERNAELLSKLPDSAKPHMEALILDQLQQHSYRQKQRAERHIDAAAVCTMVFLALVTVGIGWGLAYLAVNYGWGWWIPFGLVMAFGLLLMLSGVGSIFYFGDEPPRLTQKREKAARKALDLEARQAGIGP
ncbi:hypothetical protein SBI67_15625 [Mycolicibacterium sp. 120266]|uniref:hypothetical protein n=1 Tax=Mycolicibacterium sp. 120266 TaxID=3090601 RepID=UPI00299D84A0|nr:hypothetical protein [Mycolicibacterium sp. 120266]MDX1873552.1 hypothetical protein [Mycolicibacterium sp. 120266]